MVYLARFDDSLIPGDVEKPTGDDPDEKPFLYGWEGWGNVVVKVVSGADPDTIARLQAEVDILAAVRPANFPRLLYANLFIDNPVTDERLAERLYVTVEEFIDGPPLADICDQYLGQEKYIAKLGLGIANALMPLWVHAQRYVHRDIKPANVLIRSTGEVVVIDLGIVRETGAAGLTQTGYIAPHTPGYAAPEQLGTDKALICFKADFFAIGVVMYQLMSGIRPFHADPDMDVFDVHLATHKHHPQSLAHASSASQAFSDFVEKSMQKEQFKRQRTPDIFVAELQALCEEANDKN
ncbi:serine/threonine protein kinase [Hydrogenophaga sp. BPS33]|uniref:serine/threonine protein kinase n=1 Tax=Hydrogenophaga sp. BPS33 TaxID=2651974 RepID=UPI0013569FDE|nr:serine/threonine-protein kinase [Hydrogenophaga sp. BPS33]